jgi:hypothetical protein
MARLFAIVLLVIGLAACSGDGGGASVPPEVKAKAEALLQALQKGDLDQAMAQYDEGFFQQRSREGWRQELSDLLAERGPMTGYEYVRGEVSTRYSATFYILQYNSIHQGNKRLRHIITLLWPVEGEGLLLTGHKIRPWEVEPAK